MPTGFCNQCNRDCELIEDEGESCCMECGTVVSENRSVEAVEFSESSGGGFTVVGTRVDKNGTAFGTAGAYSRPSSEITINKMRSNIEEVVYNLKMPQQIIKGATRLYKLCLSSNFTRGRRTTHILAATIYATCRMNQPRPLPYMLLDFADYFSVNVFQLGHTFLRLSESLSLKLPLIDPSIYIPRYSRELNFGSKEQRISKCAVRIVSRMKRDWIVTGRRPGGICGAALLLASKLNGFHVHLNEISLLVHLSTSTIRKRLQEFQETATCDLTPAEFDAILDFDDLKASDPPSYTRSRKKLEQLRNQPMLTPLELEYSIKSALGPLSGAELNSIVNSPLAPITTSSRKKEVCSTDVEPPIKKARYEPEIFSDEELENYYDEEYEDDIEDDTAEPIVESLSDIEDDEIDNLLNDENEIKINTLLWDSAFGDWEQERKEKLIIAKENEVLTPIPRKQKKIAETTAEAVKNALERRLVSSKINLSAIEKLVEASTNATKSVNPLLDFVKLPLAKENHTDDV